MRERIMKTVLVLLSALLLLAALPYAAAWPQDIPFAKTTYAFKTVDKLKIHADVYCRDDGKPHPVVVWIHGGALIVGSRTSVPADLLKLCREENCILVSIDYRLGPEAKLPAIAEDVVDAFHWLRKEGPKLFRADPERIVVTGGSAGGYLTMLTGIKVKPAPRALVAYWGYGDVDGDWYTKPSEYYRGKPFPLYSKEDAYQGVGREVLTGTEGGPQGKARGQFYHYLRQNGLWTKVITGFDPATEKAKLDPYCPVRNITKEYPPILMVHGTKDDDVPYEQSANMARELARHKVPHELVTVAEAGHGLSGGKRELVQDAHRRALAFIREHLR